MIIENKTKWLSKHLPKITIVLAIALLVLIFIFFVQSKKPKVNFDTYESQIASSESSEQSSTESEQTDGEVNQQAEDAGREAGKAYNDVKDFAKDFWQGFNDETGAEEWAKEKYNNAKDKINSAFEESEGN